jgi:hypothetical protein
MDGSGGGQSSFLRLTFVIIALTIGIAFVLSLVKRTTIMEQWRDRRCDLGVMMSGFLYKPSYYNGSASDFAYENFNFCIAEYARKALETGASTASGVMGEQVKAGGVITQFHNSIRTMMGTLLNGFSDVLQGFYKRYYAGVYELSRVSQLIKSAIGRIQASLISSIYMALSMYTTIENTINFIIWVVISILLILMALFIILIFVLFPLAPLLISVIAIVAAAGFGSLVAGPARVFCFAPHTPVVLKSGATTPISQLKIGQQLRDGVVEGMFEFNGLETEIYELHGVHVSGGHLVYDDNGAIVRVADHKDAVKTEALYERLYCPIISSRTITTRVGGEESRFADWEEIAETDDEVYDTAVRSMLGLQGQPTLVSGITHEAIISKNEGYSSIEHVKIGEYVLDKGNRFTEVLGIMKRVIYVNLDRRASFTDGTIIYDKNTWTYAAERGSVAGDTPVTVYQLITSSGTYGIWKNRELLVVRDGTEVGIGRIDELTPLVVQLLNKGKDVDTVERKE